MSQVSKIDEILRLLEVDSLASEESVHDKSRFLRNRSSAKQALLSAILGVIPENELNVASDSKNTVLNEGKNIGREQCRQAIKELFNGVEK